MKTLFSFTTLFLLLVSSLAQNITLQTCLEIAGITAIGPSNATFATEAQAWQLRIKTDPAVIAYPESRDQVAATLACGREADIKMSAMSGGHSFAAFGFGDDGNLIINMSSFVDMHYNTTTELFTFGSGVRVGPGETYLWETAGRHFPHVRHAHPGLAGSMIGGGFGTTSRLWGAPMDNLVGIEYMLYNGTIVVATADTNPDLFWAAKGAGSSFGVMLSLTTKTHKPIYDTAINFTISFGKVDTATAAQAYLSAQQYVLSGAAPDEIAIRCNLPPASASDSWSWAGYYYGDAGNFTKVIAPLMATLPKTATIKATTTDFWTLELWIQPGLDAVNGGTSPPRSFYIQSLTTKTDKPLTLKLFTSLLTNIGKFNRTDLTRSGYLDLWGGSFSATLDPSSSSYSTAKNLWLIRLDGNTNPAGHPFPGDGVAYMKGLMTGFEKDLVAAGVALRGFANYRDTDLTEAEWSQRLYGAGYERLKTIKRSFDPEGYFTSNAQSIPI